MSQLHSWLGALALVLADPAGRHPSGAGLYLPIGTQPPAFGAFSRAQGVCRRPGGADRRLGARSVSKATPAANRSPRHPCPDPLALARSLVCLLEMLVALGDGNIRHNLAREAQLHSGARILHHWSAISAIGAGPAEDIRYAFPGQTPVCFEAI
jgi:hypothetical protein